MGKNISKYLDDFIFLISVILFGFLVGLTHIGDFFVISLFLFFILFGVSYGVFTFLKNKNSKHSIRVMKIIFIQLFGSYIPFRIL